MKNAAFLSTKHVFAALVVGLAGTAFGIGAPTGLAVAPVDYTQADCNLDCSAKLSWTAPADGAPTGYRIYRRLAAHEHPTLAGTVDAGTTAFTDTTAAVGRLYQYTVAAVDAEGEGAESAPVSYRKLENVALAARGNVTLNAPELGNGAVANANDGAINNVVLNGNSAAHLLILSFKEGRRPRLEHVRLNFGSWGENKIQKFYGHVLRAGAEVATEFNGSSTLVNHTFTQGAWNQFPVAAALQEDTWTKFTFGGGNYYGNCRELEAYGYLPSGLLGTPDVAAPVLGDGTAVLSWQAAANAASYTVYRRMGEGAWEAVATGVTTSSCADAGLADGAVYTYRVAAVAANGDESSAAEGVTVTAQAAATEIPAPYGLAAAPIDFTQAACNIDCSARLSWELVPASCYDQVRVYRFLKGHEDETPAPVATLDKAVTTFTDASATPGRAYVYRAAGYDSATGREGPLSQPLAYRRLKIVSRHGVDGTWSKTTGEPLTSWGNWQNWNNLSDGVAGTGSGIRIEGNGTLRFAFSATARPKLAAVRAMSANMNNATAFYFRGAVIRDGTSTTVAFDGGSTTVSFPKGEWTVRTVAAAYADDVWGMMELANSSGGWQYPCFSEVEAYGHVPADDELSVPELGNPVADKRAVALSWTAVPGAASYTVYRRMADGAWAAALRNVTATTASDAGATFDGTTYTYRVAAVAANGDEISSAEKTVLCPTGASVWWNALNVKSVAFPGASAYANPSQVKPHFMSRDKSGTLLVVPMSTDNGTHPAVTFDFAALVSADNLGELSTSQTDMKQYGIFSDFGGGIDCWKGAAVSDRLIVVGNGATGSRIAVIERATGACVTYALLDASGAETAYALDGGFDFDAAGEYLYSNDGAARNRIVKWQVDATAKTLKRVADYTAEGFTRIRNLTVCTVGGAEYAFFGEGTAKTGKIGALKLADGAVSTVVTDAETLGGDIMNVKLAQTDDGTYLVAQLDTAAVGVYRLDVATLTATLETAIDAATMQALYGTVDGGQYRNFEMTADGRYAVVMNNAGAATRLVVIGAAEPLLPTAGPALTATSDYGNKFNVTLSWTDDAGVAAEAVRIFRAQPGKPGAFAVADVAVGAGTYVDASAVPGVPYAYSAAYVHTVNGTALAGARGAEVESMALVDLKTKKTGVYRTASSGGGSGTVANLFDDDLGTGHGNSGWGEQAAFSVREPVVVMAARFAPTGWAASDSYPRADNLRIYGKRTAAGGNWYDNKVLIGTGPGSVRGGDWVAFTLNAEAAPDVGYDYVTFASGSSQPYLNLQEIDVYGALAAARAAALAKASESARDDAPTSATAEGHALAWTESGACSAVRILRSRTEEGPFVEIARVAAGTGAFVDATAVDGVVYYYQFAYETEFEGVASVGTPSAVVADYGVLLSENGRADKRYLRAANPVIASDYHNGPDYLFDGRLDNNYNNDTHAKVGLAFRTPVVVRHVRIRTLGWAASDTYPRADNVGIYGAPADWSGTSGNRITSMSGAVKIGASPATCRGDAWFDCALTDVDSAWSYLVLYRDNWFGNLREVEFYGYPQTAVETAKTVALMPVEDLAATMDGSALTLGWTVPNALAKGFRVERRVNGGAWTELAELPADARSYMDATVEIGRHSEYRVWSMGDTESVYAKTVVTPLLDGRTSGARVMLNDAAKGFYVDAFAQPAGKSFTATLLLDGTTAAQLGVADGVRIDVFEGSPLGAHRIDVVRAVADGALSVQVKLPGQADLVLNGPKKADSDGIRLLQNRRSIKAFYHTPTEGWVVFAERAFDGDLFTDAFHVGVAAHSASVSETTPANFRIGTLKLTGGAGSVLIVR